MAETKGTAIFFYMSSKSGILMVIFRSKIYGRTFENMIFLIRGGELIFCMHFFGVLTCFTHYKLGWKFFFINAVHWRPLKKIIFFTYHRNVQLVRPILLCTHYFLFRTFLIVLLIRFTQKFSINHTIFLRPRKPRY